jgi:actin-related protein
MAVALIGLLFASPSRSQTLNDRLPANEFVRQIIDNELQAEQNDHSHWMLRLETQKSGKAEVREVVETRDGALDWLISVNGKSPAEDQQRERERGLQRLVSNPAELRKSQRERDQDIARSQHLLKMLPDGFVFDYGERRGDLQEMKFKPNPHFRPPSHEAAVFHAMEGVLWVNAKQKRLAEISGHLTRPVKFGGGLLGHLDAGGQFYVKQEEVQPGYWELTVLNVDLKGRALFFKTIDVQEKMERSRFRRVRDDLSAAQGAQLLYQQVKTASGGV